MITLFEFSQIEVLSVHVFKLQVKEFSLQFQIMKTVNISYILNDLIFNL